MFQFRRFPTHGYLIHHALPEVSSGGFPHSDISGSKLACSSPKLFAAYHVLHRLIVPRHPSCALSSLTTKKTFAPGTLSHSGLSLLLFLSTKKLFLFLQILFQDTFFDCQSTPRSPAALPLLPQRKSFLIKLLIWWAYLDLNQGPRPYQGRALTN